MSGWISKVLCLLMLLLLLFLPGTGTIAEPTEKMEGGIGMMDIQSSAFEDGNTIPKRHTCDAEDVSPQLSWSATPDGTKSIVLICDDPDAPMGTWVHWILFGLSPETRELPEGVPDGEQTAGGATHGRNDFGNLGYGGPCPPPGPAHRYFFKLYALDTDLALKAGATKADVIQALEGHILAEGQLMGRYGR